MSNTEITTPAEAAARIEAIPLDHGLLTALQDAAHPGHRSAVAQRNALYAAAFEPVAADGRGSREKSNELAPSGVPDVGTNNAFFVPPADPKDYRFDPAPHGASYDAVLDRKARGWFHQAGMPQWLARNIVREWNRTIERPPVAENAVATEQSLRQRWGDAYEDKIAAAQSLVRSLKSDEVTELLDWSGLANSEYLIRQLVALIESGTAGAGSRAAGSHQREVPHDR